MSQLCSFCSDSINDNSKYIDCELCKINPKICGDYGSMGFYSIICNRTTTSFDTKKHLKKMVRLLKIEKFKCIFKKNKKRRKKEWVNIEEIYTKKH